MASSSARGSSTLELRVGLFMLVGLAIIGYMVVVLGRFGNGGKPSYTLTVELPNASGLLKNSKVLMSGAQVGSVVDGPDLLDHARGVSVVIRVQQPTQVARNARVVVGSSGLMGDRYVDVLPPAQDEGGYYQPGETVHGTRAEGMDDLTRKGGQLVDDLRTAVANLNGTITRLDTELLKPEMFKNFQDSAANLSVTTNNFKAASEKLGGVLDEVHGVVTLAHGAMDGAKDTLASAKAAADDVRGAIGDTRKVLGGVRNATDQAVHGPGLLGTLISNKDLSDNVSALVSNLRRSGILFYKDRAAAPAAPPGPGPTATPEPTRTRRR